MKTYCSHCVFYEKQEKRCHLNLLEKAKFEIDDGNHVVNGYCRSCRNVYWPALTDGSTMLDLAKKVEEETLLKYDVIVGFDLNDEYVNLYKTIDSISLFTIKPQLVIVASNRHYLLNQSLWADLTTKYPNLKFLVNFCNFESYESLLDYSLNKVKSEFVVNTICGSVLDNKVILGLNEEINLPSRFLAYYKDSNCYIAEADILRYSVLNKPEKISTLEYIKQNMSSIGTVYELT